MCGKKDDRQGKLTGGIILIGIGFVFLLTNWGIIPDFWQAWPIILIVVGAALIIASRGRGEKDQKTEEIPPPEQKV